MSWWQRLRVLTGFAPPDDARQRQAERIREVKAESEAVTGEARTVIAKAERVVSQSRLAGYADVRMGRS